LLEKPGEFETGQEAKIQASAAFLL
jgi:hypothetical protein